MNDAQRFFEWFGHPEWFSLANPRMEFVPLQVSGQTVAVASMLGSEIHFAIDPAWRCRTITRTRLREFLGPLLNRFGFLTTTAVGSDRADRSRFLERMGFEFSWDEPDRRHFVMTRIPFQREN